MAAFGHEEYYENITSSLVLKYMPVQYLNLIASVASNM